ncbi:hypothetical protein [Paraburkholderia hayleyella]|uniref:hypothetical protein n=1 Tax=Paraburkholderia hayleyella TaxID=2152889 RepID=UPI00129261F2
MFFLTRIKQSAYALPLAFCGLTLMTGCVITPPGPSPIYSRLPADQSGLPNGVQPLTEQERQRYDAIDRQVMTEQNQAIAAEAAAQAYARYYAPPTMVYGGYYGGGWGRGWGTGIGYNYGPGWGWGWGW